MRDRLRDGLTVPFDKTPGTYYEYSQSGPALPAESVQRAVGEDFQAYAQRELFGPLGIERHNWFWRRDQVGHTQGFFGLNMSADDFGRLGDLLRRGGLWRGRRLLLPSFIRQALSASRTNGCYGWLIWINSRKPCVGPRVSGRPVSGSRDFPTLPPDLYRFSGLFGQIVSVFPSQDVMVVRTGQESTPGVLGRRRAGSRGCTSGCSARSPTSASRGEPDAERPRPRDARRRPRLPDRRLQPRPVPARDRPAAAAARRAPARPRDADAPASGRAPACAGLVTVRLACPARWPGGPAGRCFGPGHARGRAGGAQLRHRPGRGPALQLPARPGAAAPRSSAGGKLRLELATRNRDTLDGTPATEGLGVVRPPIAPKVRLLDPPAGGCAAAGCGCGSPARAAATRCCRGRLVLRSRRGAAGWARGRSGCAWAGARSLRMRVGAAPAAGRLRLAAKTSVRDGYSSIARRRVRIVR